MRAVFVTDNRSGTPVNVPEFMGKPREDQMRGTRAEQLVELAGRICYDSLGAPGSRPTTEYLRHLRDSGHLSTMEHAHVTLQLPISWMSEHRLLPLVGVPDLHLRRKIDQQEVTYRLTLNLRHALEPMISYEIFGSSMYVPTDIAPIIFRDAATMPFTVVEPETEDEVHVTFALQGTRAFSHEMVRHRRNISQRSQRYCDESKQVFHHHVMLGDPRELSQELRWRLPETVEAARRAYTTVAEYLEPRLVASGLTVLDARKQARGAARMYLGAGTETELLFTASVAAWRGIFAQRCGDAADAEIRTIMRDVRHQMVERGYILL